MTVQTSAVLQTAAAAPEAAVAHFAGRLSFEADVSDVAADIGAGVTGWALVDSRSQESWDQGHVPGAIHLPTREIAARAASAVPAGVPVVTYCWGPGCNGATKAALEFAKLGYPVRVVSRGRTPPVPPCRGRPRGRRKRSRRPGGGFRR